MERVRGWGAGRKEGDRVLGQKQKKVIYNNYKNVQILQKEIKK